MKQIVFFFSVLFVGLSIQAQQLQLPIFTGDSDSKYATFEILKDAADKVAETGIVEQLFVDTNWTTIPLGTNKRVAEIQVGEVSLSIEFKRVKSLEDVECVEGYYSNLAKTITITMYDEMGDFKGVFYHEFGHFVLHHYGIVKNLSDDEQEFVCELLATQYSDLAVAEGVEWLELIFENQFLKNEQQSLTAQQGLSLQAIEKLREITTVTTVIKNFSDSIAGISDEEFEKNRDAITLRAQNLIRQHTKLSTEVDDLLYQRKILELTQEKYSPSYPEDMELWNRMFTETTYRNNLQRFYGYEKNLAESVVGNKVEVSKNFLTQLCSTEIMQLQIPVSKDFKKIKKVEVVL